MIFTKFTWQILITFVILFGMFVIYPILYRILSSKVPSSNVKKHRKTLFKRLLSLIIWVIGFLAIIVVWNFGLDNIWTSIVGVLAVVAIGFFAVWSMFSNLVAGILLYLTKPFKIGDKIKILPDDVSGEVLKVNSLFTELKDDKENTINIPNNVFFQKFIVVSP